MDSKFKFDSIRFEFVRSIVHSFVRSFIHLFAHSYIRIFAHRTWGFVNELLSYTCCYNLKIKASECISNLYVCASFAAFLFPSFEYLLIVQAPMRILHQGANDDDDDYYENDYEDEDKARINGDDRGKSKQTDGQTVFE